MKKLLFLACLWVIASGYGQGEEKKDLIPCPGELANNSDGVALIPFSEARLFPKDHATAVKKWILIEKWKELLFQKRFRSVAQEYTKKHELSLTLNYFDELTKNVAAALTKDGFQNSELTNVFRYLGMSLFRDLMMLNLTAEDEEKLKRDLHVYQHIELKVTQHPVFTSELLKKEYPKIDYLKDEKKSKLSLREIIAPHIVGLFYTPGRELSLVRWPFNLAVQYANRLVLREVEVKACSLEEAVSSLSIFKNRVADFILLIFLTQFDVNNLISGFPEEEFENSKSLQTAFNRMSFFEIVQVRDLIRKYCNAENNSSVDEKDYLVVLDVWIEHLKKWDTWNKKKWGKKEKNKPKFIFGLGEDWCLSEVSVIDAPVPQVKLATQIDPLVNCNVSVQSNQTNQLLFLKSGAEISDSQAIHYLVWFFKETNKIIDETKAFKQAFFDTSAIPEMPLEHNKQQWLSYLIPQQSGLFDNVSNIKRKIETLLKENDLITGQLEKLAEEARLERKKHLENNSVEALEWDEKLKSLESNIQWVKSSYLNLHQIHEVVEGWVQELKLRLTILYAEPSVMIDPRFTEPLLALISSIKSVKVNDSTSDESKHP